MSSSPARRPRGCWSPTTAFRRARQRGRSRAPIVRRAVVRRRPTTALSLLAVGAVVPRKGYDVLIAALARLKDLPWRLVIAGDRTRDPETVAAARGRYRASRSRRSRSPCAAPSRAEQLAALYAAADLFVLPRVSKATAWPMPRRSRTACRSSARLPAPSRIPCRPTPACWSRPTTSRRSRRRCGALIDEPRRARNAGAPARAAAQLSVLAANRPRNLFARRAGTDAGMSGFSAEWLSLREPYDLAARNADRARRGRRRVRRSARRSRSSISPAAPARPCARSVRILPPRQNWRLVDNDLGLLARASTLGQPPQRRPSPTRPVDLARDLERRSTGRSTWSRPRRCSISFRPTGWTGSSSKRPRGACRSMPR